MALIKCKECGKEISDQAEACPNCGCPLNAHTAKGVIHFYWANMKGNTFLKTNIIVDGTPYGELKCGHSIDVSIPTGTHTVELYFKEKCVIEETIDITESHPEEYFAFQQALLSLKRVPASSVKNWNKTNKLGTVNTPKCPTCGSTKIVKISMNRKILSVGMIGLASTSAGKTFKCKNCGYMW
mgnify:CR=1 FL=1